MTQPLDTISAIKMRRTIKPLSDTPLPAKPADKILIEALLEAAYWAPFHYVAHRDFKSNLSSDLPFRFYVLDAQTCRDLNCKLDAMGVDAGKLTGMLNSTDYLIQATWTPQPSDNEALFEPSLTNMEHIAAAGAAIQNILLTATALRQENYWGSGGVLRQNFAYDLLGIPKNEILLGSLFLFPNKNELPNETTIKFSPKRDKRGTVTDCYRWVSL